MRCPPKTAILFFSIVLISFAGITESAMSDTTVFKGEGSGFSFIIPETWTIDNQNGLSQGMDIVLYPSEKTWSESPVILYGKSVSKTEIPTIKLQTEITVQTHRNKGSYNYAIEKKSSITLPDSKSAELFFFSKDQWGNFEAIAYFEEDENINYLVYNARTRETFDHYFKDFQTIIQTYKNLSR